MPRVDCTLHCTNCVYCIRLYVLYASAPQACTHTRALPRTPTRKDLAMLLFLLLLLYYNTTLHVVFHSLLSSCSLRFTANDYNGIRVRDSCCFKIDVFTQRWGGLSCCTYTRSVIGGVGPPSSRARRRPLARSIAPSFAPSLARHRRPSRGLGPPFVDRLPLPARSFARAVTRAPSLLFYTSTWYILFSRRCCAWRRNASPLMQSSWTAWCNSKERRKGEKRRGGHRPEASTDRGRRRRPRLFGECCTLTMQALYRDHQKGWKR